MGYTENQVSGVTSEESSHLNTISQVILSLKIMGHLDGKETEKKTTWTELRGELRPLWTIHEAFQTFKWTGWVRGIAQNGMKHLQLKLNTKFVLKVELKA